jgi:hypothetical protein
MKMTGTRILRNVRVYLLFDKAQQPRHSNIITRYFIRSTANQTHSQSSKLTLSKVFRPLIFCVHSLPQGILAVRPIRRILLDFTFLTTAAGILLDFTFLTTAVGILLDFTFLTIAAEQCQTQFCCVCNVIATHFILLSAKYFPQHNVLQQM